MNVNKMKNMKVGMLVLLQLCAGTSLWAKVTFAYPYADGMVLQRDKAVLLQGTADAGEKVTTTYFGKKYTTTATPEGKWTVELPAHKAGGPYTIQANEAKLQNVLLGDVWLCSGQSNMELPTRRVMDKYADEITHDVNNKIRLLKVDRQTVFSQTIGTATVNQWNSLSKQAVYEFSAVAYFFAKEMYARTGVPQGVIQAAVGGTPIQAWIDLEHLNGYPLYQSQLQLAQSDAYRRQVAASEFANARHWGEVMEVQEQRLHQDWKQPDYEDKDWSVVDVFQTPWATNRDGVINGVHWFRKTVQLTEAQATQPATLRLGCLVDADSVFVNGTFVGNTTYRYPPRIYAIPQGVLKAGENCIAVRLVSNAGKAEFVADKFNGIRLGESPWLCHQQETVVLDGTWKHKLAVQMPSAPGSTFFYYTPTVLYYGMIAPLAPLSLAGAVWYQGESNVGRPLEYKELLHQLMRCWRSTFRQPALPFMIVEMADYERPVGRNWQMVQQAQCQAAAEDSFAEVASAKDLGEWNDIHPLNKKTLAVRLADKALKYVTK